jgi:hypothetical protein
MAANPWMAGVVVTVVEVVALLLLLVLLLVEVFGALWIHSPVFKPTQDPQEHLEL